MATWYGPPYSPILECTCRWEDSNDHLHHTFISDGYRFIEVPWYPHCPFIYAGSTSSGLIPPASASPQPDVAVRDVNPLEETNLTTEHQEVTFNLFPSLQPSPCQPPPRSLRTPSPPRRRRSPTPQIAQATPHLSPIPCIAPARMSTPSLSDEEARRIIETWIMKSDWRREHEMEPAVGDPGVPTCALQLALKGQSVYCCFLLPVMAKKGKISGWKSATDPTNKPYRHQRAIGRERDKRDHYPFKCPGDHSPGCVFKGCSKENLNDHLAPRNNPTGCPQCSKPIATKNMRRHLQTVHRQ